MGYQTRYNLDVKEVGSGATLIADLAQIVVARLRSSCEGARYSLNDDGMPEQRNTWYDHNEDLRRFSRQYPDYLFVLSGEGEESGDIWTEYFVAGKCQVEQAEIRVGDFDPKKLI